MAIDDNTVYGLTGAQVKELPEKIEAVKGLARELTAADYNWPENNPNGVAIFKLPSGIYVSTNGTTMYRHGSGYVTGAGYVFIVNKYSSGISVFVQYTTGSIQSYIYRVTDSGVLSASAEFLTSASVINNLVSTSTTNPLSANQGLVLKSQIGDLTTLDTTAQTDLVSAINEIAGSGGGPTVVQTTGASTTDVMSQASTSQMIFPSGFETSKDRIALGDNAVVSAAKGIAIGQRATSSHAGSVAIGHGALTHVIGEVNIGSTQNTAYGYNNTSYRLLTGLHDPQSAHDAATKGYVDTTASGIQALANYSTTEASTGATWIDGSTIYKKTIDVGALPNNTSKDVAHGITNLATVVSIVGTAKDASGNQISLPFTFPTGGNVWLYVTSGGNIQLTSDGDRSGYSGQVTLYYTKSS